MQLFAPFDGGVWVLLERWQIQPRIAVKSPLRDVKVNDEQGTGDKVKHFQCEAAKIWGSAFQEGRLTADPLFEDLLQQDTPEVQAYKLIQGMLQLARNQILLKSRLDDHEQRLEAIESQLAAPAHTISQSQAMQLSQAVKAVAFEYGKQTKRNEHPAIYGEMYR